MKFKDFVKVTEQDTKRESILKIYQMKPKVFVEFLKDLRPFVQDGQLDLEQVQASEKVDGAAIRFGYFEGQVFLESARSGIQTDPEFFKRAFGEMYRETLRSLQDNYTDSFKNIATKYGDFKVIGEMFYLANADIDEDGTVTFIATKYNANSFGDVGSMVMFDETVLRNNQFILTGSYKIRDEVAKLSNKDWTFIKTSKIKLSGNLKLTYTIGAEELEDLLNNPDNLLKPENTELAKDIQDRFVKTLEQAINERGSVFGLDTSTVEGIVLNIKDKMVGASNPEWSRLKKELFKTREDIETLKKDWLKSVTGGVTRNKIASLLANNEEQISRKFMSTVEKFRQDVLDVVDEFEKNKGNLPKNVAKSQRLFIDDFLEKLKRMNNDDVETFKQFVGI